MLPDGFSLLQALDPAEASEHLASLHAEIPWEDHIFRIFGRSVPMPRRIAWFGAHAYGYSGIVHPARPMPTRVAQLAERVRVVTGHSFNCVLMNLYRNGADSMGWHADDDYVPHRTAAIASLSLGAERRFDLRPIPSGGRVSIILPHGSVLLMGEGTQSRWQHQLPKVRTSGVRINLTFRDVAISHPSP